jgi:hypothetical protein
VCDEYVALGSRAPFWDFTVPTEKWHTELLDRGSASWRRRDEDYLCFASELAESLRAMDNGPVIFNT